MIDSDYSNICGWATIVAYHLPDPHAYNLSDPVEVVFDFEPDASSAPDSYRFPEVADSDQRLTVGAGANPSRTWVKANDLELGSRHRCIRRELIQGVGPPVIFDFPDLEDHRNGYRGLRGGEAPASTTDPHPSSQEPPPPPDYSGRPGGEE